MYVTSKEIFKDNSNADAIEILNGYPLPSVIYTNNNLLSTNQIVSFDIILDDFDFSCDVGFDDGNGNITYFPNRFDNISLTASYPTEGLYSPVLSTNKINAGIVWVTTYNNLIHVHDTYLEYDKDSDRQIFTELVLPNNKSVLNVKPSDFVKSTVFNLVVDKYYENLNYLLKQLKLYSQNLPYIWNGWYNGQKWDIGLPSTGSLSSVKDIMVIDDKYYTIENNKIVIRDKDYYGTILNSIEYITDVERFIEPVSMTLCNGFMIVLDKGLHSFYAFSLDGNNLNYELFIGGKGKSTDNYKFLNPENIFFKDDLLYVCDTGNSVLKRYTSKYHWNLTISEFDGSSPLKAVANNYIFVLCSDYKIRVYDLAGNYIKILQTTIEKPINLHLDENNQELLYVFSDYELELVDEDDKTVAYFSQFPKLNSVFQKDKEFIGVSDTYFGKFVDYLSVTVLGNESVSASFWNKESIYFNNREFHQHSLYNDSFKKMKDNLKLFIDNVSSRPVNYYGFNGDFLYQTVEDLEVSALSCDFSGSNIGINEILSYDVMKRQWNEVYDLTECVMQSISNQKRHLSSDALSCLTWGSGKSGYKYDTNTISWPISWEEMDCSVTEVPGNILGVLPQHWTWNQLRCERPNAPSFSELVCDNILASSVDTWMEMRDNEYTWNNTRELSTIPLTYNDLSCNALYDGVTWNINCGWVENPSPNTWRNLNCCLSSYNVLPYDFFGDNKIIDKFAWSNMVSGKELDFTFAELSCTDLSASEYTWDNLNSEGYTWKILQSDTASARTYEQLQCGTNTEDGVVYLSWNYFKCASEQLTAGIIYFDDILYLEDDCL